MWAGEAKSQEDLRYRNGYSEGVERSARLLDSLLSLAKEEVDEMKKVQELLKVEEV